jgi:hypothetical protein
MGFVVGVIIVLLASRVIWKWLGLGRSGGPAERSNARGSFGLLLSRTYAYCLWISAGNGCPHGSRRISSCEG